MLFTIGRIFSPLYAMAMRFREYLYARGVFKQHRLPAFVISVGNITIGGTGKTPLVQCIAAKALRQGKKPAVISRGYGGKATRQINIVSDGKDIFLSAVEAGDEPRLLAENLPGVPVLTGIKRYIPGQHAIHKLGADCIILDDGFQHLGVKRDLNLVLFNADSPLGLNRVLPGGDLRESLDALKRADGFIITGCHDENRQEVVLFQHYLENRFPDRPFFYGKYVPLPHLKKGLGQSITSMAITEVLELPLYGFCGIANPASFKTLLDCHGFKINGFLAFQDHHVYTHKNKRTLLDRAHYSGAQALITTSKDFVKLKSIMPTDMPIFSLEIELVLDAAFDGFLAENILNFNRDR
jgi:tetraacyldisaccharide 4'-kinase